LNGFGNSAAPEIDHLNRGAAYARGLQTPMSFFVLFLEFNLPGLMRLARQSTFAELRLNINNGWNAGISVDRILLPLLRAPAEGAVIPVEPLLSTLSIF
jgi:hypothetical protein